MIKEADDFRDALLGPLRRAFTFEDANVVMHVHAVRYHFMRREKDDFAAVVRAAAKSTAPWSERDRPRLPVEGPLADTRYGATVAKLSANHGFLAIPDLMQQVFVNADHLPERTWDALREGMRVQARLLFNCRGPIARDLILPS